jgi:ADP-heptose:LPS heptosyltransferase
MKSRDRILVFQIGSLGDTVISMPCYREIMRRHPDSERYLLTNFPIGKKMVQAEALLAPCGLIDGCVEYPMPLRGFRNIKDLYRRLRSLKVDILYYLIPEKRLSNAIRHYAFFRACGIKDIRGVPWTRDLRYPREVVPGKLWESEASRLLRTIGAQNKASAPDPNDRSLDLTSLERAAAAELLAGVPALKRFVAISVGGKVPINNWGDENWSAVLKILSASEPGLGIVFVGSQDERERNDLLAECWSGPKVNACGRLTPRETAAVIERAALFLGHDTGTLHLAAAVDTRVLGLFSARNVPGLWYSDRLGDRFLYNQPPCYGCGLSNVPDCPNGLVCMTSHSREEIVNAAREMLADV